MSNGEDLRKKLDVANEKIDKLIEVVGMLTAFLDNELGRHNTLTILDELQNINPQENKTTRLL